MNHTTYEKHGQRTDYTPTPEQADRGIRDDNAIVVVQWIRRTDVLWEECIIREGLQSSIEKIRKEWESRLSGHKASITDAYENEDQCLSCI